MYAMRLAVIIKMGWHKYDTVEKEEEEQKNQN